MLGKHRIGFVIVLVLMLGLVSTTLAGAQSNIYLPLATSDEQTAAQPSEQAELDDTFDALDFEALDNFEAFSASPPLPSFNRAIAQYAVMSLKQGRQTFRFDTFGSESFWGDALGLHRAIAGELHGGVGPGLSPSAFYHDGRFATLLDVVNHYNQHFQLSLSEPEKADLVEFLKSLGDVAVWSR